MLAEGGLSQHYQHYRGGRGLPLTIKGQLEQHLCVWGVGVFIGRGYARPVLLFWQREASASTAVLAEGSLSQHCCVGRG